ncbi:cytochrome P450 [Colletotrichum somersetense]|nr:cytochrome P450 [Colletotrichum somersetense]
MQIVSLLISFVGLVVVTYLLEKVFDRLKNGRRPPLPPGPRGLPVVGNVKDLPGFDEYEAFHWLKHKEKYGPISSITAMGTTMVILNDLDIASELLEKRSIKHSSRPLQVFAGQMVGAENLTVLLPYGDRFRVQRKKMGRIIGSRTSAAQYNKLQEAEVGHLLVHMLKEPDQYLKHLKREAGSLILKMIYGYSVEQFKEDPLVQLIDETNEKLIVAFVPGNFLVDIFPLLRYIPSWVPGAGFQKIAKELRTMFFRSGDKPYAFVEHQIAQGKDNESFLSHLLRDSDSSPETVYNNKYSALALFSGGADTTVSSVATFLLAMMVYPEAQKKAQEEIGRVVGQGRLPGLSDRENLPYVDALAKEVMRWNPVAPMGVPHASTEDDVVEGYSVPKGSMLLANIWHFAHDPERYPDPMEFKPERFLGSEPQTDPARYVFGFGRRICPGRYLADNSIYLNIVQLLAAYNISKPVRDGLVVEPEVKFLPGSVSRPVPFDASIKPRSPQHEKLIRAIEETHPWQASDAKTLQEVAP